MDTSLDDGEDARRAQRLKAEEEQLDELREKYHSWHLFRIAGGWGAVLKDAETARTATTLEDLAVKLAEI